MVFDAGSQRRIGFGKCSVLENGTRGGLQAGREGGGGGERRSEGKFMSEFKSEGRGEGRIEEEGEGFEENDAKRKGAGRQG